MDNETVIKVEHLSKKFTRSIKRTMLYGSIDIAKSMLGIAPKTSKLRKGEFWALNDANFELKKGEALGILGINGSGKSTLLRLLTGIFPPDHGMIQIKGSIGSLIAVGAGFHPHMTGRENIFLNGTILGMSKNEISEKFQSIIDFADIGNFIDAPVSTYSSGMRVRLGFAIAIHCDPDILLIDEILSVGDLSFRNKSLRHMAEYRKRAKALIFVSHDIEQVRILCNRVIIMEGGKIIFDGPTHEGIVKYEELSRDIGLQSLLSENNKLKESHIRKGIQDNQIVKVEDIGVLNAEVPSNSIKLNSPLELFCDFDLLKEIESLSFYLSLSKEGKDDLIILLSSNDNNKYKFQNLQPGKYRIKLLIKDPHLTPGVYTPNISFRNDVTFETYNKIYTKIPIKISSDGVILDRGVVMVEDIWSLEKKI